MSTIKRLSLPMRKPEDVVPYLGKPSHWKYGRSAKSVADSWFRANGLPPRVRALLHKADEFVECEFIDGWLERETDLGDGAGRHSQTDLLAVIGLKTELAILGIEAKVDESFGPLVSEWLADNASFGKKSRLAKLTNALGIAQTNIAGLRYQLLHRTAAVILEAKRYRAKHAIMLVHSFCPKASGFGDFSNFSAAMGFGVAGQDMLSDTQRIDGINLRLGWVSDEVPEDLSWDAFCAKYPPSDDFPDLNEKYDENGKWIP